MATLTEIAQAPGRGGRRPLNFGGPRVATMRMYTFAFDTSYPTGGEDLTAAFNDFQEVVAVMIDRPAFVAATGKHIVVDKTTKKILLYDNAAAPAQVANASDQSLVTGVVLTLIGY